MPNGPLESRFEIIKKLHSGGMGEVFLARDRVKFVGEPLVLKSIHPFLREIDEFMAMFRQEAEIAAILRHPNIVSALEYGTDEEEPFILMRYYESLPLNSFISLTFAQRFASGSDSARDLRLSLAAVILCDVCDALSYIHNRSGGDGESLNIVHRDVNPQNILVCRDGTIRLCDFGIAKWAASDMKTRPGVYKGKFAYMAKEQLAGEAADCRADLFALGAVAYEMITGQAAMPTRKMEDLFSPREGAYRLIRENLQTFPTDLSDIILRLLEREREKRPENAVSAKKIFAKFIGGDESELRRRLTSLVEASQR